MIIVVNDKVKDWFPLMKLKGTVVTGYQLNGEVHADTLHSALIQEGIIYKHQLLTLLHEYRLTNIGKSILAEIKKHKKKSNNESKGRKTTNRRVF